MFSIGRRTRATASKSSLKTSASKINGHDALASADPNFASPKRKDFKLDTDSVPLAVAECEPQPAPSANGATTNGRRINKSAIGPRSRKPNPAITNYFAIVDEPQATTNETNVLNVSNDVDKSTNAPKTLPVIKKSDADSNESNDSEPATIPNGIPNGLLMSPELKSLPNGMKQTTPHRIVCHHTSPSTHQRPYAKDTAQVFSHLNLHDSASPKSKASRRRNQAKSRRKLNVENNENGATHNGFVVPNVPHDTKTEKPITNNNFVANGTVAKQVRDTLMNDFFPIRRSVRKTQKAIEEEQSRYIEKAIDEQRQDGLSIHEFEGKGRGIVAARPFQRGEFVVEYIGELIDPIEAEKREAKYMKNENFGCYMYYFKHKEQHWW